MMPISNTVKHLLILNVLFFIGSLVVGPMAYDLLAMHFPYHADFQFWQLISHMFMHGNVMHIAFNMLALWMFGSPLEQIWGRNKFLFFYFSAGLGAVGLQLAWDYWQMHQLLEFSSNPGAYKDAMRYVTGMDLGESGRYLTENGLAKTLQAYFSSDMLMLKELSENSSQIYQIYIKSLSTMVGASGAIYGILVAFAFVFPNARLMMIFLPIPIKAKYFVPLVILGDLIFGFSSASTGIAHFAHLGGAITGFLIMKYWNTSQFDKNRWDQ